MAILVNRSIEQKNQIRKRLGLPPLGQDDVKDEDADTQEPAGG